jgi:hypothetical protein
MKRKDLPATSFRLSEEARYLLAELAKLRGISLTAELEVIIREEAKRKRISRKQEGRDNEQQQ